MPTFDVHAYVVVRVKRAGIEAESPVAAAQAVLAGTDFHQLLTTADQEYAEDINAVLVDEVRSPGLEPIETLFDGDSLPLPAVAPTPPRVSARVREALEAATTWDRPIAEHEAGFNEASGRQATWQPPFPG